MSKDKLTEIAEVVGYALVDNDTGEIVEKVGDIDGYDTDEKPPKDFRPEHLKRMGVTISKGDVDE